MLDEHVRYLEETFAIVRSAAENSVIFDLIKKQKAITNWGVWLGLVRKADTEFYWIDDTAPLPPD